MNILDVAKEAGVSKSTVSLVVNDSRQISEETTRKVREAMKRIGYEPRPREKRGGRRKSMSSSLRLALVSLNASQSIFDAVRSSFYMGMLEGIESTCRELGHTLSILHVREEHDWQILKRREHDGLLLFSGKAAPDIEWELSQFPCVSVFGPRRYRHFGDWVSYDDVFVGELAVEYLMSKGCRVIATTHDTNFPRCSAASRYATSQGLQSVSLPSTSPFKGNGRIDRKVVQTVIRKLKSTKSDGLFLSSDMLVNLFYPELRSSGFEIGENIHVIGCNNSEAFRINLTPRPATISIRPRQVGRAAVRQLIWRLENPYEPIVSKLLAPEVITT